MKKCLFIVLAVVWGSLSFIFAENVPVNKALQVATHFTQQIDDNPLRSGQFQELADAVRPSLRAAAPHVYYYGFNRGNNGGYGSIAGDDRVYPVLGYGTTGDFSYEKIPDNMTSQERTYKITWSILPGVTVVPEPGYDPTSVPHGENFKFKLKCTGSKFGVVQVYRELLPPDTAGVYTLKNVQEDIFIELYYGGTITYRVTLPVVTGFDIQVFDGYDVLSVRYDSDFKFTVIPKAGYEAYTVKVTANNVVLTPASGNVYTIRNVKADQTVKVEVTPPKPPTYQILSRADRGAILVPESGYDADAVVPGENFKFHVFVDPAYRKWEVKVEVDGLPLWPDSRGVYTISNIRANKNVVIALTEVYTITFVKPKEDVKMVPEVGYDAGRIVAGYDFKFHLVSRYTEDQLTVAANGVTLRPVGKIYSIYGIRENQEVTVFVNDVANEKISADNVRIQVVDNKLCITHPTMKNVPVYVVSFDGTLSKADKLNGVYTELELPGKGAYIVSFEGFSQKIMVR